jgi:NAD(P)-dependent dehydrogenase (short-subunit alcohol dehydrogenase family)
MSARFSKQSVLVAGGTGGLGRAVTIAFLQEEARVIVTYRKQAEFDTLKTAAGDHGARLEGKQVDVTNEAAVRRLSDEIKAEHGGLDAMVNAVGGYTGGPKLWEASLETFEQMLALNFRAGMLLARSIVPIMLAKGHGAIVNIASKAAIDHAAGSAAYASSKAAALAMFDSLAEDLRGTGVRANTVLPSIIDTEPNRKAMPKADFSKWPKPEDIARVILFLCCEDAKLIHGAAVPVYGNN